MMRMGKLELVGGLEGPVEIVDRFFSCVPGMMPGLRALLEFPPSAEI